MVKRLAVESLVSIGPVSVTPLLDVLGNPDPVMQDLAAAGLAKIGAPAVGPLLELLLAGGPKISWTIMDILGNIKDEDAIDPIIGKLRDALQEFDSYENTIFVVLIPPAASLSPEMARLDFMP